MGLSVGSRQENVQKKRTNKNIREYAWLQSIFLFMPSIVVACVGAVGGGNLGE